MLSRKVFPSLFLAGLLGACGAPEATESSNLSVSEAARPGGAQEGGTEASVCDIRYEDHPECGLGWIATVSDVNCRPDPCTVHDPVIPIVPAGTWKYFTRRVRAQYYGGTDWWLYNYLDHCWMWEGAFAYSCP